jgi:hypothetical protein
MSYHSALKKVQQYEEDLALQQQAIQDNAITRHLNFNPKYKVGLGLGTAGLRMSAGTLAHVASNDPSGLAATISPAASYALAAAMPLTGVSQMAQDRKRVLDFKAQREALNSSPSTLSAADALKSGGLIGGRLSQVGMNSFMATMAAGALTNSPGLTSAAGGIFAGSRMLTNPFNAAAGALGLMNMGGGGNMFTAGTAAAPAVLGHVAGAGLSGAGWLAGKTGFGGAASLLADSGKTVADAGTHLMSSALGGNIPALMAGILTTMVVSPKISKLMTKITSKASGQQLLKEGAYQRPRTQSAHLIAEKYSTTRALDQQVNMLGQSQQLKMAEWLQLSYLGAIEKNTSMNRYMAEFIQEQAAEKTLGADTTQDNIQGSLNQTGIPGLDLSGGFQDTDEIDSMPDGISKWFAQKKRSINKAIVGTGEFVEKYSAFLDPMAYLKSGDDNPFQKYKRIEEDKLREKTTERMSEKTGLSVSFINALETSATEVANMGASSQDKLVALAGYNFEVNKISAFKLLDIANALGIDQEGSFMGKFRDAMDELESEKDKRKTDGWTGGIRGTLEGVSKIPFLPAIIGGAAGIMTGGLGAAVGAAAAPAIGALAMDKWSRLKGKSKGSNTLKTDDEVLDEFDSSKFIPKTKGISIDAEQLQLAREREEEEDRQKRLGMYEHIALIHEMMDSDQIGAYVRIIGDSKKTPDDKSSPGFMALLGGLGGAALGAAGAGALTAATFLAKYAMRLGPIGALVGSLWYLYDNWDETSKFWGDLFTDVKETTAEWITSVKDDFTYFFGAIGEYLYDLLPDVIKGGKYGKTKKVRGHATTGIKVKQGNNPGSDRRHRSTFNNHPGAENYSVVPLVSGAGALAGANNFNLKVTDSGTKKTNETIDKINNLVKEIAARGKNQNAIDTPAELRALLLALNKDQQSIGQLSVNQQNAMIEQLSGLIQTIAGVGAGTNRLLSQVVQKLEQQPEPEGFRVPR